MADAARGAQPRLGRDDRSHELIGMQAALDQQLAPPAAHQLHRLGSRSMAVLGRHDGKRGDIQAGRPRRFVDARLWADQHGQDQPGMRRVDYPLQRMRITRVRDDGGGRGQALAGGQE